MEQINDKTTECEKYEQALNEIRNVVNKNNRSFNFNNLVETAQLMIGCINDFKRVNDIISKAKDDE